MAVKLILSTCGCSSLIYDAQYVIDSNYLPTTDINIGWLEFDGDRIDINETFASITALLASLNGSFKTDNNKAGSFFLEGDVIFYNNPEGYINIEIMAILQTNTIIIKFGTGGDDAINNSYGAVIIESANGTTVTSAALANTALLMAHFGSSFMEPKNALGVVSYTSDGTNGTIQLFDVFTNTYVYLLVKQIPA